MIPREILRKVRRIEIRTRRLVAEQLAGTYHSVFKGRGMEFSEVREYMLGDDVRTIDWNVTARMGRPFVKRFVEERELTIVLLVDASGSLDFGSAGQLKREVAAEICAVLAFTAIRNNDRVGLITFTDDVERHIPPRKGRTQGLMVIREVLYYRPRGRGTDLGRALEFLHRVLHKRAVVFILSDFRSPDFETPLRLVAKRHDVIAVCLTDPRERALPVAGIIALQDAETGARLIVDTASARVRDCFQRGYERFNEERSALLRSAGVDFIDVNCAQSFVDPLVRFFDERARRVARTRRVR
ncbi:MAG: DUF58 domain-containing protein [Armatimonadota bacterium]